MSFENVLSKQQNNTENSANKIRQLGRLKGDNSNTVESKGCKLRGMGHLAMLTVPSEMGSNFQNL